MQHLGRALDLPVAQGHPSIVRVVEDRHPRRLWHRLLEELEALGAQGHRLVGHPGDVAARPGEAVDQAEAHRVADEPHHDRDRGRGLPGRLGRGAADRHDRVHVERDQLGREGGEPLLPGVGPAHHVRDVPVLDVAELLEGLTQGQGREPVGRARPPGEERHLPHLLRLRRRDERREQDTASQHSERGPPIHRAYPAAVGNERPATLAMIAVSSPGSTGFGTCML